ncbi:CHAD domain-containing protein [Saccharibacillus sp. JS10]|uniref:CHAD domain-containing protein n=1 Tax=Saccharibacillus sp. JS10 TaxID=2950552 RepID=UPI00210DBEA7|nr:CHAD domain-containing protein [Saccharibacillus sp. JS10]MCQ4088343.1 CHAD domain-containing protein [Saccharibacillus sp. JS10]
MTHDRASEQTTVASDQIQPWSEALEQLYSEFRKRSRAALKDYEVEDIHQARVSARKLLTLIQILDPDGETGLYRIIKKAQKRFGRVRDADVMIADFKKLRQSAKSEGQMEEAKLYKKMTKLEKSERDRQRKKLSRKLPKIINRKLDKRWQNFIEQELPDFVGQADVRSSLRMLKDDYRKRRHMYQVTADREGASSEQSLDALHQVRIAAKRFRYTAEAAAFALEAKQAEEAKHFKKVQKKLGDVNDRHVRIQIVEDYGAEALNTDEESWNLFRSRLDEQLKTALSEVGEL